MDLEKCFTVHLADLIDLYWIIFDRGFFFSLWNHCIQHFLLFFLLETFGHLLSSFTVPHRSNLLCTQHESQVLFNLHPGSLLFLLCVTIVQSASIRYAKLVRSPFRQFCGVPPLYTELLQKIWGGTLRKKMVPFSHSSVLTGDVLGF